MLQCLRELRGWIDGFSQIHFIYKILDAPQAEMCGMIRTIPGVGAEHLLDNRNLNAQRHILM